MNNSINDSGKWLWMTVPVAILLAVAAGGGVFLTDLYRDAPNLATQAVAQDYVSLSVVLPALIVAALLASRGSARARLVWLGCLVYLVYSYLLYAFHVKHNSLFLAYVALLGCSLYALIGGLVTADKSGIRASFARTSPAKAVSIYLAVFAVLFYLIWLSEIVPALLAGVTPPSLLDDGTPTNGVHVLDMAWILPAIMIAAVSLWRKQALGYTLAGAMLSFLVFLISAMLSMAVFFVLDGHPDAVPQVVAIGALVAVNLGMLTWLLASLKSPHTPVLRTTLL